MGKIDVMTKEYLSHNDVFADAFNYLIYGGKKVICPEKLQELDTTELALPYGTEEAKEPVQKYRDVLKTLTVSAVGMEDERAAYVILGIESQTNIHYAMPVRNMLYDALQYAKQVEKAKASYKKKEGKKPKLTTEEFLSGFRKTDRLIPVITLVVYFGPKEWDGPLSILEMLHVEDPALLSFIQNYKINLLAPAEIEDEDFSKFRSGLGAALLCVKHSGDEDFDILKQPVYQQLDYRTAELVKEISSMDIELGEYEEGDKINMCKAYENSQRKAREEGRAEGRAEGHAEGHAKGHAEGHRKGCIEGAMNKARETAINLKEMGLSDEKIAKAVNVSLSLLRQWIYSHGECSY